MAQDTVAIASTPSFPAGARPVTATPAGQFNKFASPNGTGNGLSYGSPGSLSTMISGLVAGDRLALLGGTYSLPNTLYLSRTGTAQSPILIESYPGELVVFRLTDVSFTDVGLDITGSYYVLRRLKLDNFNAKRVVRIRGTGNIVEGNEITNSPGLGVETLDATNPVIRDNQVHDLSNVGWDGVSLPLVQYGDGGWSDGIQINQGTTGALIEYNTLHHISDDGIDAWGGATSVIRRNISYRNGIGSGGRGIGIKYSGPYASGGIIQYNFSFSNKGSGFNNNAGPVNVVEYNSAWDNGEFGIRLGDNMGGTIQYNNSVGNASQNGNIQSGPAIDNSWQRAGTLTFQSTTYPSDTFLKPTIGGGFENIGAWK